MPHSKALARMDVYRAPWGDTFSVIPRTFSGIWVHVYNHETNAIHSAVSIHQACGARASASPEDRGRSQDHLPREPRGGSPDALCPSGSSSELGDLGWRPWDVAWVQ